MFRSVRVSVGLAAASQCGVAKAVAKCQSGVKDSNAGPWSRGKAGHASLFGWKYVTCPAVLFGGWRNDGMDGAVVVDR